MRRALVLAAVAGMGLAPAAWAQGPSAAARARLEQSLDEPTMRAVTAVFQSAQSRGLPVQPLVNRALEATMHRAPGKRVHAAVSTLADRLAVAKSALAPSPSDAEIAAGADALAVGVPRETLTSIRALSAGRPVTVPLGVLTELVTRRVTVTRASAMVAALMRNGATPAQLVSLSDDIAHDIDAGIDPRAAFDIRTRGVLGTLEQGVSDTDRQLLVPGSVPPGSKGSPKAPPSRAQRKP